MKIPLKYIALELTDRCNLACRYCYNIWKIPGVERTPFDSFRDAIRTLKQLFAQADVRQVTLTGGEPFMAHRMLEVALFCRMEGKKVCIITNGSQGRPADYRQLTAMGVSLFEMPVHAADPAVHDAITQCKDSWQKSVDSLLEVKRLGAVPVAVIVLTRLNVDMLADTLDFLSRMGLHRVMLNRYNIGGAGTAEPMFVLPTQEQLLAAYRTANLKSKMLGLRISSNVCTPLCIVNPTDYPRIRFGNCSSDPLKRPVTVDIRGDIRLCNHSPVKAGNIFRQHLHDILYSPYAQSWNETIPCYCASCELWETCRGGCRAASEQCGLGLAHADPLITAYTQPTFR